MSRPRGVVDLAAVRDYVVGGAFAATMIFLGYSLVSVFEHLR